MTLFEYHDPGNPGNPGGGEHITRYRSHADIIRDFIVRNGLQFTPDEFDQIDWRHQQRDVTDAVRSL